MQLVPLWRHACVRNESVKVQRTDTSVRPMIMIDGCAEQQRLEARLLQAACVCVCVWTVRVVGLLLICTMKQDTHDHTRYHWFTRAWFIMHTPLRSECLRPRHH
jgi:hypothetical protein